MKNNNGILAAIGLGFLALAGVKSVATSTESATMPNEGSSTNNTNTFSPPSEILNAVPTTTPPNQTTTISQGDIEVTISYPGIADNWTPAPLNPDPTQQALYNLASQLKGVAYANPVTGSAVDLSTGQSITIPLDQVAKWNAGFYQIMNDFTGQR